MQFKKFVIASIVAGLSIVLGTRLMGKNSNKNSVFAPENFIKKDSDKKLEDMIDTRIAAKNMKIRNPKSK